MGGTVRDLGDPIAALVTEKAYTDQQSMLDGMEPKGHHYYWKTEYLGPEVKLRLATQSSRERDGSSARACRRRSGQAGPSGGGTTRGCH
jgi:hypothetical protein